MTKTWIQNLEKWLENHDVVQVMEKLEFSESDDDEVFD